MTRMIAVLLLAVGLGVLGVIGISGPVTGGSQELSTINVAPTAFAVTINGDVYYHEGDADPTGDVPQQWSRVGQIASSSPIIRIGHIGGDGTYEYVWAYAADGSFFASNDNGRTWALKGNVFSGSTPTQKSTWGGVKVRYR